MLSLIRLVDRERASIEHLALASMDIPEISTPHFVIVRSANDELAINTRTKER